MKAKLITSSEDARNFCVAIREKKYIYIYPFFTNKNADEANIIGISFCDGEDCYYFPRSHDKYKNNTTDDAFFKLFSYIEKRGIIPVFYDCRDSIRIIENRTGYKFSNIHFEDAQVDYWLLDTTKKQPSIWEAIEDLSIPVRVDIKTKLSLFEDSRVDFIDPEENKLYLCFFSALVYKIKDKVFSFANQLKIKSELDTKVLYPLAKIESTETRFDENKYKEIEYKTEKNIEEYINAIQKKTGYKINPESRADIIKAFNILEVDNRYFESNDISLSTLSDIAKQMKLTTRQKETIEYIIELKKLLNFKSKCVEGLREDSHNKYFRFHYKNCNVPTGRICSGSTSNIPYFSKVNVMSISKPEPKDWYVRKATREEINKGEDILGWYFSEDKMEGNDVYLIEGKSIDKNIRQCFVPRADSLWVVVDADSQELRVISNLYKEKYWIDLFLENKDIHKEYAIKIFGKENYSSSKRKLVKEFIYGLNYGMSEETFMGEHPELSRDFLHNFVSKLKESIPNIIAGQNREIELALKTGYVRSGFSRKRKITEEMENVNERYRLNSIIKNTPIQGVAADITKMQMCKLWENVLSKRGDVECLFNIYDEFNFSVKRKSANEVIKEILEMMKVTVKGWPVPFTCSCEVGKNWGTTFKFKYNQEQDIFIPSIKI